MQEYFYAVVPPLHIDVLLIVGGLWHRGLSCMRLWLHRQKKKNLEYSHSYPLRNVLWEISEWWCLQLSPELLETQRHGMFLISYADVTLFTEVCFFFFTPNTFGYFYFCFSWEWILVWVIWSSTITKAIPESVRFGQYSAARRGSMITRQHIQRWQFVSLLSVTWLRSGVIAWITRPVLLTFTIYKRGTKLPRLYPSTPATLLTLSSPEKTYEGL